ncbi:acyl-CoA thioesterase [Chitiniphilus eburneus]|uniref:Thioesterase n=1 Tax=Chitiniphilus eburneus TaxID=2571148 RepID=A0A4U0PQY7_9NEIS|nr:thioesterase family protein [Chitiniphilus eburneus]TJZ65424.1 thioesterase [Chitiniphilus eburneus]
MPRIKIEPPAHVEYSVTLQVRASDLNYGGHLANHALLTLLQEARLGWLASHGLSETGADGHPGIILGDLAVCFASEAFLGEQLAIDVGVAEYTRVAVALRYAVREVATARLVATASTSCVFFDYHSRKVVPVPQSLKSTQSSGTSAASR